MRARKASKPAPEVVQVSPPEARQGKLKKLGGSTDDNFNNVLASPHFSPRVGAPGL